MIRSCRRCGESFESDRDHHRYCWPCYWELREARERDDGWRQPLRDWNERSSRVELDSRLLLDAIQLTHPDRHPPDRAKTANAVTAALLELLQTARQQKGEAA